MNEGFITIDRKITEWEWYQDQNTRDVFIHCLLRANWKDGKFQGHDVPRGSFITSFGKLANELNMSVRSVRTALSHLEQTGEIKRESTNKWQAITVVNYGKYQDYDSEYDKQPTFNRQSTNNQLTFNRQSTDIQSTTIEQSNNITREQGNKETREQIDITLTSNKATRHKYGQYKNVLLTDEDLEKLKDEFPDWEQRIERLSEYIASSGKKYKNHLATIRNWARKDAVEKPKTDWIANRVDVVDTWL